MEALIARINYIIDIDRDAFEPLQKASSLSAFFTPGDVLIQEGDTVKSMFVIESGWAIRYRILNDGRRQILNFMLPGDCFDLKAMSQLQSDHSVSAVTKLQLRSINVGSFVEIVQNNDKLVSAFWWIANHEEAILREQIIRVGPRSATERLAHLILELNQRISKIEGKSSDFLRLTIPQSLFADALSLSVVHISRTLGKLKAMGMIATTPEGIRILDKVKLKSIADFQPDYLHSQPFKLTA